MTTSLGVGPLLFATPLPPDGNWSGGWSTSVPRAELLAQPDAAAVAAWVTWTCNVVVSPALLLLGLVGNAIFYKLIAAYAPGTSIAVLFRVLAVSNTVAAVFAIVPSAIKYGTFKEWSPRDWTDMSCALLTFMNYTGGDMAIWTVVAVDVERFVAVWWPLQVRSCCSPRRAALVSCILLGLALAKNVVLLFSRGLVPGSGPRPSFSCGTLNGTFFYFDKYVRPWIVLLVVSVVPIFCVLVFSILIYCALNRYRHQWHKQHLLSHANRDPIRDVGAGTGGKRAFAGALPPLPLTPGGRAVTPQPQMPGSRATTPQPQMPGSRAGTPQPQMPCCSRAGTPQPQMPCCSRAGSPQPQMSCCSRAGSPQPQMSCCSRAGTPQPQVPGSRAATPQPLLLGSRAGTPQPETPHLKATPNPNAHNPGAKAQLRLPMTTPLSHQKPAGAASPLLKSDCTSASAAVNSHSNASNNHSSNNAVASASAAHPHQHYKKHQQQQQHHHQHEHQNVGAGGEHKCKRGGRASHMERNEKRSAMLAFAMGIAFFVFLFPNFVLNALEMTLRDAFKGDQTIDGAPPDPPSRPAPRPAPRRCLI